MEESMMFLTELRENFGTAGKDIRTYNPVTLAYIGDCVYELVIRTLIMDQGNQAVNTMNKRKVSLVKAETQALMANAIQDRLTEEEQSVYRRGKNAKTNTMSKSSTASEYHQATGMEALIGYLYLTGQQTRLLQVMKMGLETIEGGSGLWE